MVLDPLMDPISMAAESFSVHGPGGVRIVADRLGDPRARAVVFLHGGGQTRRSWGRAAAAVAERGWQAVTIDLRGHGESDWSSEGDYRLVSFAGDIQEVLRNLPGQPALVGASLGGFAAMLLAGELSPGIASGAGGHRAEYGPGRGEQDPRVHGRTGGIGVRLVGRGG